MTADTPPVPVAASASAEPTRQTNTLAIVSLALALVVPLSGIVFGHFALAQIKRSGERGRGVALAGTLLGYAAAVAAVVLVVPLALLVIVNLTYVTGY